MDVEVQSVNPQHVAGVTDPGRSCNREYVPAASALHSESVSPSPEISSSSVSYPDNKGSPEQSDLGFGCYLLLEHLYPDR